jgi:hypothetical protein
VLDFRETGRNPGFDGRAKDGKSRAIPRTDLG